MGYSVQGVSFQTQAKNGAIDVPLDIHVSLDIRARNICHSLFTANEITFDKLNRNFNHQFIPSRFRSLQLRYQGRGVN